VASQCGKCGIQTREILREFQQDSGNEQELFYALS
jgi:bacterioferritin-associated ferredoxin